MTDRAEIERLLNQTGRTLEGLPKEYPDDRCRAVGRVHGLTPAVAGNSLLHQSDVIELLVGALKDALDKRPKWISVKERLPEPLSQVWMYSTKYNSMFVGMRGLQNPDHIFIEGGPDLKLKDISHWREKPSKPEPPKEEG